MILLMNVSCKSASPIVVSALGISAEQSVSHTTDTIYQHDSIFIREYLRGDTVYLTRTEWRDRWRIREVHDTIHDTQYITQVIEHPPERYVPKFYKWCTGLLIAILVLAIGRLGYMAIRWYMR